MTYQSPGLRRSAALSATAGSTSSSCGASRSLSRRWPHPRSRRRGPHSATVSSASGSTDSPAFTASGCRLGERSSASQPHPSRFAVEGGHGCQSSHRTLGQPNTRITPLARPRSTHADERHHEGHEDQHHPGVADHLLAIGPDDLAQLGDDLLQVVPDEGERVAPSLFGLAGLLGGLRLGSRSWCTPALVSVVVSASSPSATTPRRDRLPAGRTGRFATAV